MNRIEVLLDYHSGAMGAIDGKLLPSEGNLFCRRKEKLKTENLILLSPIECCNGSSIPKSDGQRILGVIKGSSL